MKKILYFLTTAVIMSVVVSSCTKVKLPYETFPDMKKGAFARLLSQDGAFDFFNPTTTGITATVEFYDDAQGKNVASYSWTVEFIDNSPGFGSGDVAAVDFVTFDASQFSPNPDTGYPSITFTFGFQDAMNALGLTISDVTGGDVFRFEATITKTDGSTFSASNTGSNIFSSSTFAALFTLNATVVCLPTPGYFTGDYLFEQISGGTDPFFGTGNRFATRTTTVTESTTSITQREFLVDYLTFELTMVVDLVCGQVLVPDVPAGVGCGGGIVWTTDDPPATYDPNDDSVIMVNLIDDATNDCGLNEAGFVFRLTKQ